MSINFNQLSPIYQRNQSTSQEGSIANVPEMAVRVSDIGNATIASAACSWNSSVEYQSKEIVFKLYEPNQVNYQELRVKASDHDLSEEDITSTIDLVKLLPDVLQKQEKCITILDLLRKKFPLLTKSFFKKETEIPRFTISALSPEGKLNLPLQIQAKGEIAFIAWDFSGSKVVKGFKKHTCDIPFGLEKKVTVIGILIIKQSDFLQSLLGFKVVHDHRVACASDSDEGNCRCIRKLPYIGRDRQKKTEETLHPFCLEVVLSTSKPPIQKIDLLDTKEQLEGRS